MVKETEQAGYTHVLESAVGRSQDGERN